MRSGWKWAPGSYSCSTKLEKYNSNSWRPELEFYFFHFSDLIRPSFSEIQRFRNYAKKSFRTSILNWWKHAKLLLVNDLFKVWKDHHSQFLYSFLSQISSRFVQNQNKFWQFFSSRITTASTRIGAGKGCDHVEA